jgi:hypothetical protein
MPLHIPLINLNGEQASKPYEELKEEPLIN